MMAEQRAEKMTGFIVQRKDGTVYVGSGYAGPGNPVPYWEPTGKGLDAAKVYKTQRGAREAADKLGGIVGVVELDGNGKPVNWLGYAIRLGSWNRYAVYGR
jgi:hypothetical protein